jgi:uncharacterized membrane protein HdeD (DUF308 family)
VAIVTNDSLVARWWMFLLRGLFALTFGVLALLRPGAAITALVLVFGVWALLDGVNALYLAFSGRRRSWELAVIGLLGIAAAVITFLRPDLTALGLYALIAAWSIARGIAEIALAVALRKQIRGELWLILAGLSSLLFGVLLIALPAAGVLAVVWLIAVYALIFGGLMIGLAFRLRKLARDRTVIPMRGGTPQPA